MTIADSAWGFGMATIADEGQVLDVWFPAGKLGLGMPDGQPQLAGEDVPPNTLLPPAASDELMGLPPGSAGPRSLRGLSTAAVLVTIASLADAPTDTFDVWLRLHLLSHRLIKPHDASVEGVFGLLANVAWTSAGPCPPERVDELRVIERGAGRVLAVYGVDKFPRMTDYVVPSGVRIADADRVKTDLGSEATSREKLERAVGKEGLDAAMRIRDRMAGKEEGPRGLYLCHGFCELGAAPLADALSRVHEFLVQNPSEVLVLVIEDYVEPHDLAAVFAESGLDGLVYKGPPGPPWPTLREMIDSRRRVLVLTESGRPGVGWIHPAFVVMQETPYHFERPSELSCAAHRGGTGGSLFLMNNWIDTTPAPKPSNAAIVNAYPALLARAKLCQAQRGRLPTVIAVDFYRTGAVVRVARTLNGLKPPAAD